MAHGAVSASPGVCKLNILRPAVFLDRDGVVIDNRPDHVKTWSEVNFLEGAFEALQTLSQTPTAIVIVSNQGAVGRGMMTLETMWDLQGRIVAEIVEHGGRIDGSYLCPHHPDDACDCRKPAPGMIHQATQELGLDLQRSWLVGDALTDLLAAEATGMQAVLVRTGRGVDQEQLAIESGRPWHVVDDLSAAVRHILQQTKEFTK
jgi:D-glycero-D-manno-heptose 1,7-bisphosphate phosphatase